MYRDRPTENSTSDFTQILPLWCRRFPFHCLQFCNDFTENRWASLGLCPCPTGQKLAAQLVKTGLSTWILTGRTGILWLHLPDPAGSREVLYIFFWFFICIPRPLNTAHLIGGSLFDSGRSRHGMSSSGERPMGEEEEEEEEEKGKREKKTPHRRINR